MQYNCSIPTMMLALNLCSAAIVSVILGLTGELFECVAFVTENPGFLREAATFALCSALGQLVVLFTLRTFNSLVLVTITTTRKFVTILLSIVLYGHELSRLQWCGVLLVFTGLLFDIHGAYLRERQKDRLKKKSEAEQTAVLGDDGDGPSASDDYQPLPQTESAKESQALFVKGRDS